MAEDTTHKDQMGYDALAREALRGVIKAALKQAASPAGLPGEHHLYITFRTRASGVSMPSDLLARYPEEMTIVLQHQYWDLAPGETFFSVMLKFGGQPKRLSVPYGAVTRFFDPSVQFMLQFDAADDGSEPVEEALPPEPAAEAAAEAEAPKIVSLDQFRKK